MNQTILLIDDDTNLLEAMKRVLHAEGHRIRCAHTADEAMRVLKADNVDLIVTDQVMPGMSGLELINQVKRLHPDTSRILLTGHATAEMIIAAVNNGGVERVYLKPCPAEEIVRGVREVLMRRQMLESALRILEERRTESPADGGAESYLRNVLRDGDGAVQFDDIPYGYRTFVRRLSSNHPSAAA